MKKTQKTRLLFPCAWAVPTRATLKRWVPPISLKARYKGTIAEEDCGLRCANAIPQSQTTHIEYLMYLIRVSSFALKNNSLSSAKSRCFTAHNAAFKP